MMFITNKEKDWMMASIQILQKRVMELEQEAQALKKINIARTPSAPYGLKMDGTPRKRPGRAPTTPTKKESKECAIPI
jgi:hypothetical protein